MFSMACTERACGSGLLHVFDGDQSAIEHAVMVRAQHHEVRKFAIAALSNRHDVASVNIRPSADRAVVRKRSSCRAPATVRLNAAYRPYDACLVQPRVRASDRAEPAPCGAGRPGNEDALAAPFARHHAVKRVADRSFRACTRAPFAPRDIRRLAMRLTRPGDRDPASSANFHRYVHAMNLTGWV